MDHFVKNVYISLCVIKRTVEFDVLVFILYTIIDIIYTDIYEGGVVVPDSTSPGFDRIWDRDSSGPRFDPGQDSPLLLT